MSILPLVMAGCGPEPVAVESLMDQWGLVEPMVEPRVVDVVEPAGRHYLGDGWARHEGRLPYVWGLGARSDLGLPVAVVRPLELELELRPFQGLAEPQTVEIRLAAETLLTAELAGPEPQRVRTVLPPRLLIEGWNQVELHWGRSASPQELGLSADNRSLAVALHGARLIDPAADATDGRVIDSVPPITEPSAVRRPAEGREDRFWLPTGSTVDFFFDLPTSAGLRYEAEIRGTPTATWQLESEDGSVAEQAVEVGEPGSTTTWSFDAGRGPARLRLTVLGAAEDGVLIRDPWIVAPLSDLESSSSEAPSEASQAAPSLEASPGRKRDLVLYSIDTLRADRLGYRGGPVPTPHLDAWASQALVFESSIAQAPWTKASMASIFTGLWPPEHGAVNRHQSLAPEVLTLAELLSAAGWDTAAVVTNPNITATFGFDQGFDEMRYVGEKIPAAAVVEHVDSLLAERAQAGSDRPLFLWVHTIDPHSPYDPPDRFREHHLPDVSPQLAESSLDVVNDLRAGRRAVTDELLTDLFELYDTEVRYSDETFGSLLETLERHGLEEAVLTMLSDHGEEFLEHGNFEHGRALHVESLDVPWVLRVPGGTTGRVAERAQHLDVLPTLLVAVGAPMPGGLPGHPWLDRSGALQPPAPRPIFSHLHLDGAERMSILDGNFKLMVEMRQDQPIRPQLYDVAADPREQRNLWDDMPVRGGWLQRLLLERRRRGVSRSGTEVELDEETRRSLEALGYL